MSSNKRKVKQLYLLGITAGSELKPEEETRAIVSYELEQTEFDGKQLYLLGISTGSELGPEKETRQSNC